MSAPEVGPSAASAASAWALLGGPCSCSSCAVWILTAAAVFAAYVFWAQRHWARRGVSQTRPWPLFGDLVDNMIQRRTPGDVLSEIYRANEGKPYVGLYKFLSPVLLVRDADLAKEVLVQNFASFQNNATIFPPDKDEVFSDNPFVADAERWKDLRTRLSQAFSPARVRLAFADMADSARRLADFLEAGGADSSQDFMLIAKRYTAHASVRILFGIESHSLEFGSEPGVFYDMGHKIFNGGLMNTLRFIAFVSCPSVLPLLGYQFVGQDTLSFFRKLIRDSIEYRQKEGISRDDFVQHASKQVLVDGKVDAKALRKVTAQAINTYVETFETSAIATATVLLMLATHPDEQDKLRKELRAAIPVGQALENDVVAGLPFLDQVVKESLRLFPPADTLRRMCTKATTLRSPSDDGPGLQLRPGDIVYVCADALHHDPALYSHADEFWPAHFSDEELERRPKNTFLGFGEGPRHCPGMRYGMQQVKAAVASVLLRLEVRPAPEQLLPVRRDPAASFMGFKGGVWLRFKPIS